MPTAVLWDKETTCAQLLAVLLEAGTISEYRLIEYLDRTDTFAAFAADSANLRLFKKHFITRHCLYSLQARLTPDWCLILGPIEVQLVRAAAANGTAAAAADEGLRAFYLDLSRLDQTDEVTVAEWLASFWRRFAGQRTSGDAYQVLEVSLDADWETIQRAYRRAITHAHPDKGGDAAQFARLRDAYEILRGRFAAGGGSKPPAADEKH